MKALTVRLEWVRIWMVEPNIFPETARENMRQAILDDLLAAIAIAEALPEIPVFCDGVDISKSERKPPERVIQLPNG